MLLVTLHNASLHRFVLVRHELIGRKVSVIGIVFGHVITARRLHDVTGHQRTSVVVALEHTVGEISFDLQAKEEAREFLLQLAGIRGVEFDTKSEHRFDERESDLAVKGLFEVQPVL